MKRNVNNAIGMSSRNDVGRTIVLCYAGHKVIDLLPQV